MTEAEKKMKKYTRAVNKKLNLPSDVKKRVMTDFTSSIQSRKEAGKTDEEFSMVNGMVTITVGDETASFFLGTAAETEAVGLAVNSKMLGRIPSCHPAAGSRVCHQPRSRSRSRCRSSAYRTKSTWEWWVDRCR